MENNDANNTDFLQWVLMSDTSVDLTALSPPNELPVDTNSMGNIELLNYILGNEELTSSAGSSFSSLNANDSHQSNAITIPNTPIPDMGTDITQTSTVMPSRATMVDFPATTTRVSSNSSNSSGDDLMHNAENKQHSDDEDDEIPESQLKMMTSKERRQLRNKISARKFRNRRKEYITMLETEVKKQKTENSRLRLEVTWVRGTVEKLQKENDQLRLELVLCKEGIKPRRAYDSRKNTDRSVGPSPPNYAPVLASSLSPPSLGSRSMTFGHSDHSSTSSLSPNSSNPSPPSVTTDEFVELWDLVLPENHHQNYQLTRQPNTYLSYAVMPEWDLPNILDKGPKTTALMPANQLIQQYPLLVPALMSIILGHTMTMTTDDLVSHAKLLTPSSPSRMSFDDSGNEGPLAPGCSTNVFWLGPNLSINKATKIPSGQELHSIWEAQQMRREMSLETWYKEEAGKPRQAAAPAVDYCPLTWLQKQFCRFVYEQVITRYPQLEQPCRTYLPICDKIVQRAIPMTE